jgi:branched-chain amino acid transport system permease protein
MRTKNLTHSRWIILGLLVAAFFALALLPLATKGYALTLLIDILKFAVLTVAWVIFSAPTGYMSLASAAFYGLGFYIAAVFSGQIAFPILIIAAGVVAFLVAVGVGALTLRLRGVYFAIFTFALVLLVQSVVREIERVVTQTRGRFVETQSTEVVYYAILVVFVLTILTALLIRRSRYGLALQSIGEHEEAAAHSGINVVRTKVLTFGVSAIFMGMAGAIIATRRTYIDPDIAFNLNTSFLPVLMAMFGGMGNLFGPVLGAALFTYIGEFLLTRVPDAYMLIFGLVLIVAILFMPNGVLGLGQDLWRRIRGGRRAPA